MAEHIIFVRDSGQTYLATASGKRASCTSGQKQAAEALARKLFSGQPFRLQEVNRFTFIANQEGKQ